MDAYLELHADGWPGPGLLFSCGRNELHCGSHGVLRLPHKALELPHQRMLLGVVLGFACSGIQGHDLTRLPKNI